MIIPDNGWTKGPTLSAWIYDSTRGAAAGQVRLHRLCRRGAVTVVDAATVSWARGAHRPRIGYLPTGAAAGGHRGSTVGVLLERLMLPAGAAQGASAVADLARQLEEAGLAADVLQRLRDALAPDTSALVVLSRRADLDQVRPVFERGAARGDVVLLHSVLTPNGLAVLEAFASEAAGSGGAARRPVTGSQ